MQLERNSPLVRSSFPLLKVCFFDGRTRTEGGKGDLTSIGSKNPLNCRLLNSVRDAMELAGWFSIRKILLQRLQRLVVHYRVDGLNEYLQGD